MDETKFNFWRDVPWQWALGMLISAILAYTSAVWAVSDATNKLVSHADRIITLEETVAAQTNDTGKLDTRVTVVEVTLADIKAGLRELAADIKGGLRDIQQRLNGPFKKAALQPSSVAKTRLPTTAVITKLDEPVRVEATPAARKQKVQPKKLAKRSRFKSINEWADKNNANEVRQRIAR